MKPHDIHALRLLEEIEKDDSQSQRELVKKLNISLGSVNSFIKRLAHKGYFKSPPSQRIGPGISLPQKVLPKRLD